LPLFLRPLLVDPAFDFALAFFEVLDFFPAMAQTLFSLVPVLPRSETNDALSTTLVAPTSTGARAATFRPTIEIGGTETKVLVEQTTVVDPQRLGGSAGRLEIAELQAIDEALALVLGL
jgi:mRNA-degrading endonuclease toxin of MazEF toxin-antitoxin module